MLRGISLSVERSLPSLPAPPPFTKRGEYFLLKSEGKYVRRCHSKIRSHLCGERLFFLVLLFALRLNIALKASSFKKMCWNEISIE